MCGDSLISTINGERLIPDPTKEQQLMLAVTPIQQAIQPLLELQRRYFDAQTEERYQLRSQILQAEANVFRAAVNDRRQFWLGKQQEVERKIKSLKKVTKVLEKEQADIATKLTELDKFAADVESGERSLNFFQYHLHFNDVFKDKGGFDVVIGNPPYLGFQGNFENKEELKRTFIAATGKFDYYVPFIEIGLILLNQKGLLSYICPTNFMKRSYGQKLREHLRKNSKIHFICDFKDNQIFEEALNYTGIYIIENSIPEESHNFLCKLNSLESKGFSILQKKIQDNAWIFIEPHDINFINTIKSASFSSLGEIASGISEGIVTGKNSVFLLSLDKIKKLGIEDIFLKPCIRGQEIRRYYISEIQDFLIYPYENIDGESQLIDELTLQNKSPNLWNYLLDNRNNLAGRGYFEKSNKAWYELWCKRNINLLSSPKILVPELSDINRFCIATSNNFYGDTVCGITLKNNIFSLSYILGILNSKIIEVFYKTTTVPKANNFYIYKTMFLKDIPIPTAPEADRQAIETLVQKCLDAKGVGVEQWEAEIDDRVAHLYGLTAEEMKIIKGV
jgi:hypothetical protein